MVKNTNCVVLAALIGIGGITTVILVQRALPGTAARFPREVPAACSPYGPFAYPIDSLSVIDTPDIGYRQTDSMLLQLEKPFRFCLDDKDRYYIAAEGGVYRVDSGTTCVKVIASEEQVKAVTVSQGGILYAATQRQLLRGVPGSTVPRSMSIGTESTYITSIAADESCIYLADAGERLVWSCDTAGRITGRIGEKDSVRGIPGFVVPSPYMDCLLGQDGSLWVVNPGRHSVENYRRNGDLLSGWGRPGTDLEGFCGCCNPVHLASMPDGSFVTVEKGIVRVKLYGPAGTFITAVAPQKAFSKNCTGIVPAVDSRGRILVLDLQAKMIRVFTGKERSTGRVS